MKNKAIILISEAMAGILLLLFFFWRLYFQPILKMDPNDLWGLECCGLQQAAYSLWF